MPLDVEKYLKDKSKSNIKIFNSQIKPVWWFIIFYVIFQAYLSLIFSKNGLVWTIGLLLFTWLPILLIPCIIRYGYKKILTKKAAVIYTLTLCIILLFGDVMVDILLKSYTETKTTVTIWNLLMMICPYYILSDKPFFSFEKNKKSK